MYIRKISYAAKMTCRQGSANSCDDEELCHVYEELLLSRDQEYVVVVYTAYTACMLLLYILHPTIILHALLSLAAFLCMLLITLTYNNSFLFESPII
jgi:hypothetical protein